jgi:hypothetical protein
MIDNANKITNGIVTVAKLAAAVPRTKVAFVLLGAGAASLPALGSPLAVGDVVLEAINLTTLAPVAAADLEDIISVANAVAQLGAPTPPSAATNLVLVVCSTPA